MNNRIIAFLIVIGSISCNLDNSNSAQVSDPVQVNVPEPSDTLFIAPMDIPLYLSGNFGELRNNHFHSGLDIKTEGREGIPVYSVADGYVSRVKVSPWGYGNVVYIDHPFGYTTVYAHLQSFNEEISAFIKDAQYDLERYEVDLYPEPGLLKLKQGEQVALSGNSGSSGGPHLHFEIRETVTEFPVNPLLFGFDIKDNISPIIRSLMVIPLDSTSFVQGKQSDRELSAGGGSSSYYLKQGKKIKVRGKIGLAVNTIDKLNGYPNECGIFALSMYVDSFLVYEQSLRQLDFETKRYVNAHVMYEENKKNRKDFHRTYVLPGNKLNIYSCLIQDGRVELAEGESKHIDYLIEDAYGNESTLSFILEWDENEPASIDNGRDELPYKYDQEHLIPLPGAQLKIAKDALYQDEYLQFSSLPASGMNLSPWYEVGDEFIPFHEPVQMTFYLDSLDIAPSDRLLMVRRNKRGSMIAEGGVLEGNEFRANSRYFGRYTLMMDSIPPSIRNVDLAKDMSGRNSFSFRITDNLAGIESYRGEIDGQWVLMSFLPKRNKLTYRLDSERLERGEHEFKLEVVDERGNKSEYTMPFKW